MTAQRPPRRMGLPWRWRRNLPPTHRGPAPRNDSGGGRGDRPGPVDEDEDPDADHTP